MMEALQYLFFAAGLSLFIGLPAWIVVKIAIWVTRRRSISNSMTSESTRLQPESQFIVTISEQAITCQRPDGTTESVRLDDLQKVDILTTSDGPFAPDVFWLLHGSAGGCSIPQGATGEPELLDYLQTLPAFDNQAVIQAVGKHPRSDFPLSGAACGGLTNPPNAFPLITHPLSATWPRFVRCTRRWAVE